MRRRRENDLMKQIAGLLVAVLLWSSAARAEASAENKQPAEGNEFTSVVTGIVEGFEALAKAADAEPAAQQVARSDDSAVTSSAAETKRRSIKNSAILIAGGAGLGASVGKMTGKKNAAVIGAVAGAVAGLIYDRATYKNPKGI